MKSYDPYITILIFTNFLTFTCTFDAFESYTFFPRTFSHHLLQDHVTLLFLSIKLKSLDAYRSPWTPTVNVQPISVTSNAIKNKTTFFSNKFYQYKGGSRSQHNLSIEVDLSCFIKRYTLMNREMTSKVLIIALALKHD